MKNSWRRALAWGGGVVALAALVAVFAAVHAPAKVADAQQATVPSDSTVQVTNTSNSVTISLASPGPYSKDFRYEVCWIPAPNYNNPWPEVCEWSAWASDAGAAGQWSTWIWPGHSDEMQSGSKVFVPGPGTPADTSGSNQGIQTRDLPNGVTSINGITVGIQLSEDNSGNLAGTSNDILCQGSYTNGGSATAYGHLYGNQCDNNSDTPDVLRTYIASGGSLGAVETASNLPSSMTVSATSTSANGQPLSITIKNVGATPWLPNFNVQEVDGTQQGNDCNISLSGSGGVKDAPSSGSTSRSCSITANLTSANYFLAHAASQFAMSPENIPIGYSGVTQTITYHPARTLHMTVSCTVLDGLPSKKDPYNILSLIPTAHAMPAGGSCVYNYTVPESWTVSYSGGGYSPSITTGQSYTFALNSITAPSTANTYTEQWQMTDGSLFGSQYSWPITVGGASGTITVTSENAMNTSTLVSAKWDVLGQVGNGFVCADTPSGIITLGQAASWNSIPCSGDEQSYPGLPSNDDLVGVPPTATTTLPNYTLRSVQQVPIAQKENTNILGSLKIALGNVFSTVALAQEYQMVGSSTSTPGGIFGTLTPQNNSVGFVILWNPLADMQVCEGQVCPPNSISLTSPGGTSQAVTVQNTGASYSTLTWTATATTADGINWLSVTPGGTIVNGASGGTNGATNTATISYTGGLADATTTTGTVTFDGYNGTDTNGKLIATQSIPVTLTVGNGGQTYYICTDPGAGTCSTTSTPGYGSCTAACAGNPNSVTASCSPSSIHTNQTSQCTVSLNGATQNNASWALVSGNAGGSIGASSGVYTPVAQGSETVQGTLPNGSSAQATVTVTAAPLPSCTPGAGGTCPVCDPGLTASPSSVVVPESSNLSYSCKQVTECQLVRDDTGQTLQDIGAGGSGTIDTTANPYAVAPTSTTAYTLACVNSNYAQDANNPVSSSATVTVSGSTYCEQNPNGVGCQ